MEPSDYRLYVGDVACHAPHIRYGMTGGTSGQPLIIRCHGERRPRSGVVVSVRHDHFVLAERPGPTSYYDEPGRRIRYGELIEARLGPRIGRPSARQWRQ